MRQEEWCAWSKAGQRPSNIPSDPARAYRDDGWISMPDWFGYEGFYGNLSYRESKMLTFEEARVDGEGKEEGGRLPIS